MRVCCCQHECHVPEYEHHGLYDLDTRRANDAGHRFCAEFVPRCARASHYVGFLWYRYRCGYTHQLWHDTSPTIANTNSAYRNSEELPRQPRASFWCHRLGHCASNTSPTADTNNDNGAHRESEGLPRQPRASSCIGSRSCRCRCIWWCRYGCTRRLEHCGAYRESAEIPRCARSARYIGFHHLKHPRDCGCSHDTPATADTNTDNDTDNDNGAGNRKSGELSPPHPRVSRCIGLWWYRYRYICGGPRCRCRRRVQWCQRST